MSENEVKERVNYLLKNSKMVILSTINEEGYPESRSMLNLKNNEALKKFWFTTNASSRKIQQILRNEKTSIYFTIPEEYVGVTFFGKMSLVEDIEVKKKIWQPGWEIYYPNGVNDPDNAVLLFNSEELRYYAGQKKYSIKI